MTEGVPSAEELVAEFQKAKVGEFLVHTCSLIASLGFGKLAPETRDLEQARLAIETLRAVIPVLEGTVGEDVLRDFRQVTANLQLAFADASKDAV